jgi:hypothetical protein
VAWDWVSFGVGVAVGLALMWIAAVLAQAREAEQADKEEHFR